MNILKARLPGRVSNVTTRHDQEAETWLQTLPLPFSVLRPLQGRQCWQLTSPWTLAMLVHNPPAPRSPVEYLITPQQQHWTIFHAVTQQEKAGIVCHLCEWIRQLGRYLPPWSIVTSEQVFRCGGRSVAVRSCRQDTCSCWRLSTSARGLSLRAHLPFRPDASREAAGGCLFLLIT